jgi:DNA polymerase-3 subunit delta
VPTAPPRFTLVIGDEELFLDRAVAAVIAAARDTAADTEVTSVSASATTLAELAELLSPTLFGGPRYLVLRDIHEAGKELATGLPHLLGAADDAILVATHNGGPRGKALLAALSDVATAVVRCPKVTSTRERGEFLAAEVNAAGRRIDSAAVSALLATVGTDLRELANVTAQLLADTNGTIGEAAVARYTRGRADATGFAVADRAMDGDLPGALEVLRWALAVGVAPVLVTSSLASNLRLIARVAGEGRGQPARIAKTLGQPAWKVEKAMRWSRGWSPVGLSTALRAVAVADGDVKGAAVDAGYAVERMLMTVVATRRPR